MSEENDLILYTSEGSHVSVQVKYEDGTFWLTQKRMADLFGVSVKTINEHLGNLYVEGELKRENTLRKIKVKQQEGNREVTRTMDFYHLDAIIAVGYRVNSSEATQFRIWATRTLRDFIVKGFVLDKERLKQGEKWGKDYFDELLEQVREIRASERRFYQKITDIYALSVDYNKDAEITKKFFATVQNKLHWAISGKTAAEIVYELADATKPHMGLSTWKHAPEGKILKSDVTIAKNYLSEKEIKELNGLVSAYLDLAENRAAREIPTTMKQWSTFLDQFLSLAEYPLLMNAGKISKAMAQIKAWGEYDKFRVIQDREYVSDFDRMVKQLKK